MSWTGLPQELFAPDGLEFFGELSLLEGGLISADRIVAVSPSYAREIQTPEFGEGLEGVYQLRRARLLGIANGLDADRFDPGTDEALPERFDAASLAGKRVCREAGARRARAREARAGAVPGRDRPAQRAEGLGRAGRVARRAGRARRVARAARRRRARDRGGAARRGRALSRARAARSSAGTRRSRAASTQPPTRCSCRRASSPAAWCSSPRSATARCRSRTAWAGSPTRSATARPASCSRRSRPRTLVSAAERAATLVRTRGHERLVRELLAARRLVGAAGRALGSRARRGRARGASADLSARGREPRRPDTARCQLGRLRHELRARLRARRVGRAVSVRERRRAERGAAHRPARPHRRRLPRLPAGRAPGSALRLPRARALGAASADSASTRTSSSSIRTRARSPARCAGTRRCSRTTPPTRSARVARQRSVHAARAGRRSGLRLGRRRAAARAVEPHARVRVPREGDDEASSGRAREAARHATSASRTRASSRTCARSA